MMHVKKLRVEWSEVGEWGSQTKFEDKTEQDVLLFLLQCSIQSKCMFRQRDVWCALVRSDMLCNMTTLYIKDNDHSVGYDVLV